MRVISRLYVRIVASPGSIPTRTAPLVVAITGTQEKPVSIKNLNAFERSFFTQKFKDGDWKMSSTNVMEKNNRKVEITNDSGKLTVKAVVEQSDQPENNYDVYEDIDMRFHRQQKSEQEFTILLRRRLEQRLALGRRIAKARVRRGMSQKILATKLGVTPRYIAQAEIGDTSVTKANIELIANVLEVSIGYLYGFTQIMDGDIILYMVEICRKQSLLQRCIFRLRWIRTISKPR